MKVSQEESGSVAVSVSDSEQDYEEGDDNFANQKLSLDLKSESEKKPRNENL